MKAPFPYFGGKRRVAEQVWAARRKCRGRPATAAQPSLFETPRVTPGRNADLARERAYVVTIKEET